MRSGISQPPFGSMCLCSVPVTCFFYFIDVFAISDNVDSPWSVNPERGKEKVDASWWITRLWHHPVPGLSIAPCRHPVVLSDDFLENMLNPAASFSYRGSTGDGQRRGRVYFGSGKYAFWQKSKQARFLKSKNCMFLIKTPSLNTFSLNQSLLDLMAFTQWYSLGIWHHRTQQFFTSP